MPLLDDEQRDEARRYLALAEGAADVLAAHTDGTPGLVLRFAAEALGAIGEALRYRTPEEVLEYLRSLPEADRLDLDAIAAGVIAEGDHGDD